MASRTAPCAGCRAEVSEDGPYMKCAKCKQIFDIICANITTDVFKNMSVELKMSWICGECRCRQPKRDNSHTPVRPHVMQDQNTTSTASCLDVSMQTSDNVTVRTKPRYAQTTMGSTGESITGNDLKDSVVRELKNLQIEFEAQLMSRINKLLIEQFLAFKTEFMDRVNLITNKVLQLEEHYISSTNKAREPTPISKILITNGTQTSPTLQNIPTSQNKPPQRKPQPQPNIKHLGTDKVQSAFTVPSTNKVSSVAPVLSAQKMMQAESSESISLTNSQDCERIDKEDWQEVSRKRARPSLPGLLRGTAAPGSTMLHAAERRRYLHLYYVREGTTVEQVREHLNSICGSDECTVEKLKSRGHYASFKLGVPVKQAENIMSSENWAEDICIKPWRQNFRAKDNNDQASTAIP